MLPKYPEPIPKSPPINDSPILFNPRKLKVDKFVILENAMPAIKPNGISQLRIFSCLIFLSSFGFRILMFSISSDLKKLFVDKFNNCCCSGVVFSLDGKINKHSVRNTDLSLKTFNKSRHFSSSLNITILLVNFHSSNVGLLIQINKIRYLYYRLS